VAAEKSQIRCFAILTQGFTSVRLFPTVLNPPSLSAVFLGVNEGVKVPTERGMMTV
jgi:hypothetical protein